MRYRPFNAEGLSCSVVSVSPPANEMDAAAAGRLVVGALEFGVNSFQIEAGDMAAAAAVGGAVDAMGRHLLVLALTLGGQAPGLDARIAESLKASRARYFDILVIPVGLLTTLQPEMLVWLKALRVGGFVRRLALAGEGEPLDVQLDDETFAVLLTTYNVKSDWPERNRIKRAAQREMTIIGRGFDAMLDARTSRLLSNPLKGLFRKSDPIAHVYDFMRTTKGWTAQQIAFAYALTEPALATIEVRTASLELVESLSACVERELPAGVAAQIEIARFAAPPGGRRRIGGLISTRPTLSC